MITDRQRAALAAWRSFDGSGPATQAFLLARLAVVPLGALDTDLRSLSGRVLSLGCGHGLLERYLAQINQSVEVDGYELDQGRVEQARRTQGRSPRVRVHAADVTELDPVEQFDAALAVDVMHHLPASRHGVILETLRRHTSPGGRLLVKDIATEPRAKYLWNRFHDRLVAGDTELSCRSPEDMAALAERAGYRVDDVRRMDRHSPYPHYLVAATVQAP